VWLLQLDKMNRRANLYHKSIVARCLATNEDREHMLLQCLAAHAIWRRINIPLNGNGSSYSTKWSTPIDLPKNVWNSRMLVVFYRIWDARIAMLFRAVNEHPEL
jgi:hypothetical protein